MEGKRKRAEPKGDGRVGKRKSSSFRRNERRADPVAGCRLIGRRTIGTAENRPPSWISALLKINGNSPRLDLRFASAPEPLRRPVPAKSADWRFGEALKRWPSWISAIFEKKKNLPSARPSIRIRSRVSSTPGSPETPGTSLQPIESVQNKARGGHLGFRTPSCKTVVSIKCPNTLTTHLSDTASLCDPVVPQTPRV